MASYSHRLTAVIVGVHCDVISCELARRGVRRGACGLGNAVGLTSILDRGKFFSNLLQRFCEVAFTPDTTHTKSDKRANDNNYYPKTYAPRWARRRLQETQLSPMDCAMRRIS